MLSQHYRLRRRDDFERAYRSGKHLRTAFFRIVISKNQQPTSRFGVVVPNKLIKKAVPRNKKKRQIRSALQALVSNVAPGYDVIIMAQPPSIQATVAEMKVDLQEAFVRLGIFIESPQ